MKIISTKAHGVMDYLMGILLIAAPWLLGFANGTAAQWVPVTIGILMLVMALCTNYEPGVMKIISMQMHLTVDFLSGLVLAASPWIFNFDELIYLPHLILGILEMGAALMTRTVTYSKGSVPIH